MRMQPKFHRRRVASCDNCIGLSKRTVAAAEESFANGPGFLEAFCNFYLRDRGDCTVFRHQFGSGANKTRAGNAANAVAIQETLDQSVQRANSRCGAQLAGINALSDLVARVRPTRWNAKRVEHSYRNQGAGADGSAELSTGHAGADRRTTRRHE